MAYELSIGTFETIADVAKYVGVTPAAFYQKKCRGGVTVQGTVDYYMNNIYRIDNVYYTTTEIAALYSISYEQFARSVKKYKNKEDLYDYLEKQLRWRIVNGKIYKTVSAFADDYGLRRNTVISLLRYKKDWRLQDVYNYYLQKGVIEVEKEIEEVGV